MQTVIDQLSTTESWRMFRIMAEIVDGFETLNNIGPCISIFGSARVSPDDPLYQETEKIAQALVKEGYGIITGGGPGIMEAGNKGALEAGGKSIGLHINLPTEQACNEFVNLKCSFRYFFVRKLMFIKYAHAYIVMPGGMGTLDELSEAFVLAQTKKIKCLPIIFYNSKYWGGLIDWLKEKMVGDGYIRQEEIDDLVDICDSAEDIVKVIKRRIII